MSKTSLKKELSSMTKEQVIEVVLELYSARKEVKEYFEFYLNPNPDKLIENHIAAVDKEFRRSKWGQSKARITVIKKIIRDFESFSPGIDYVLSLYRRILLIGTFNEGFISFPPKLLFGMDCLLVNYLTIADKNMCLDTAIEKFTLVVLESHYGSPGFKNQMRRVIEEYLQSNAI